MDDIQGKIKFIEQLKAQGVDDAQLQELLSEYDAMDEEQQSNARSAMAQLHLQGSVDVPERDLQNNQKNAEAVSLLRDGTYDPERDNFTPPGMRSEADQKKAELFRSMGLEDPTPGVIDQIETRAQYKPKVGRSSLIVRGREGPTLRPPKVKP